MTRKNWALFGCFLLLLFLTGCDYNKDLFKPDEANCWPCKLYMQAFEAISLALAKALPILCDNCLAILEIAFPVYLVWKVLPWIYSFQEPEFEKDIKEIVIVFFKTCVVALLLSVKTIHVGTINLPYQNVVFEQLDVEVVLSNDKRAIYDVAGKMILQPMGEVFLNISQMALATPSKLGIPMSNYNATGLTSSLFNLIWEAVDDATGGLLDQGMDIVQQVQGLYTGMLLAEDPMFGQLPRQVQSIIFILYQALWSGMGLAMQLFQLESFMGWVSGVVLFCGLFYMVLILPISFIEAILTMGLTIILLPVYLLFWIFPVTSKGILKKVFHNLFAAFFDILFNCIYVAFLVSVIRLYLQTNANLSYLFSSDFQTQEGGMRLAASNLNTTFLIMTVLVWTILKLFNHVNEYSAYFFDGAGKKTSIVNFINRLKSMGTHLAVAGVMTVTGNFAAAGKSMKDVGNDMKGMVTDGAKEMNN